MKNIITTYRSPNYARDKHGNPKPRPGPIDSIVLHTGEGTKTSDLSWLCSSASGVSSHYYIDRAGLVYELMDLSRIAWHAGQSRYWTGWWWRWDWNSRSIGIETEHKLGQDWPPVQVAALAELTRDLAAQYAIKDRMIVAHRWIATPRGRKGDPSNWPDAKLTTFITHRAQVGLYRIGNAVLPHALIRAYPEAGKEVTVLGTARPAELIAGRLIEGVSYNGNKQWLELLPGPGYIWSGLVVPLPEWETGH